VYGMSCAVINQPLRDVSINRSAVTLLVQCWHGTFSWLLDRLLLLMAMILLYRSLRMGMGNRYICNTVPHQSTVFYVCELRRVIFLEN
jgi:hypothetical protein